eukprot:gene11602-7643_t
MLNVWDWKEIDERLQAAFPHPLGHRVPFGGLNVIATGDWFQLPSIEGGPAYSPLSRWDITMLGQWRNEERMGQL